MSRRSPLALASVLALTVGLASCTPPGRTPGTTAPTGMSPTAPQAAPPAPAPQAPVLAPQVPAADTGVTPALSETGAASLKATETQKQAANDAVSAIAEIEEFETAGETEEASLSVAAFATQDSHLTASPSPSPSASTSDAPGSAATASPSPVPSPSDASGSATVASPAPSAKPVFKKGRTVVENPDGTITVTMNKVRRTKKGASGEETLRRTFTKAPRKPVKFEHERHFTGPKGYTRDMIRVKTWTETGWTATLKIAETLANGKQRKIEVTTSFNKADGTWTRTGSITRFDGSQLTYTRTKSKTESKVEVTDTRNKVTVKGAYDKDEKLGQVNVSADGAEAGTVTPPATDSGTETES